MMSPAAEYLAKLSIAVIAADEYIYCVLSAAHAMYSQGPKFSHKKRIVMNPLIRSLIASLATFAAFWYIYWILFAINLELAHVPFHWMWIIRVLGSIGAAAVVAQYTWRHKSLAPQGPISCIILGAAVLGGVGFSAGYFGPMILDPGSQGPLLGMVTGPLGFLVGAIGGAFYWALWVHGRDKRSNHD